MSKFKRKIKKGFTLVELLAVVVIIGVLTAVAVPSYQRVVEKTKAAQGITTLQNIAKAQNAYNARRGSYASNMFALPIDLKDKNGDDVEGDTFEDQYFDYTVYGNLLSQSTARRGSGWDYELAIDYDTGKLYCTPEDNKICQMLGFETNAGSSITNRSGSNIVCQGDTCYLYSNNKVVGRCYEDGINAQGDGCASNDRNGFLCEDGRCAQYSEGFMLEGTDCSEDWVNSAGTACAKESFKCDRKRGLCITYKDDEEIETCPINAKGTGCADIRRSCDQKSGICTTYQDGEKVSVCDIHENIDCANDYSFSGTICEEETCTTFKDGQTTLECNKGTGICTRTGGGECSANKNFDGCAKSELVCNEGDCSFYNGEGQEAFSCDEHDVECYKNNNYTGTVCDGENKCFNLEDGKTTLVCRESEKECTYVDDAGNETTETCTANATLDGCAKTVSSDTNGLVCEDGKCTYYKDGKEKFACKEGDWSCYENNKYSGVACDADGHCVNYEKGKVSSTCNKDEKICVLYDQEGNETGVCTANGAGTGCVKDELICDEGKCTYYKDGKKSFSCKEGDWECYEKNKYSGTACDGEEVCRSYEKGSETLECYKTKGICYNLATGENCTANAAGTACASESVNENENRNGLFCDGGNCTYYKDGKESFTCADGDFACYQKNKYTGVVCDSDENCLSFQKGQVSYKCSSASGQCTRYDEYGKESGTCTANAAGTGCITGEVICANDKCVSYDEDGDAVFSCPADDIDCFRDNKYSGTICNGGDICYSYDKGQLTVRCNNDNGVCEGFNEEGNTAYECYKDRGICYNFSDEQICKANAGFTACSDNQGENPEDGFFCYANEGRCYTYEGGRIVDGCTSNITNEVCAPKDEEEILVCYKDKGYCYGMGSQSNNVTGECRINTSGTSCSTSDEDRMMEGKLCDKEKCYTYEGGEVVDSCPVNDAGNDCR